MSTNPNSNSSESNEEYERIRPPKGIIQRIKLGKLAVFMAGVELTAGVASLATNETGYMWVGAAVSAAAVGGTIYGAHEHHVNGYSLDNQLMSTFIEPREWPTQHG